MKTLSILGSTGSIGRQTLSVVESLPNEFRVAALAAGNNLDVLLPQILRHHPELVSVATPQVADELARQLKEQNLTPLPAIHHGREGMLAAGTQPGVDIVISAAVGVVGLEATYKAVTLGRTIALSNKEVLVAAGELVMAAAAKAGRELLPVDSEHNAVHQCLRAGSAAVDGGSIQHPEVRRIVLTASGGPFRKTPIHNLAKVTVEQALAHPNWKMGNRITIDSATMMNKGFEVIEARWLFGMSPDQIDVIIHPQSVIHSFVEFVDGAVLAQLAPPDMRMPIQYALTYPARVPSQQVHLDWAKLKRLDFEKASTRRFPCLRLAREAMKKGGAHPAALNAADEVAVAAFLENRLPFMGIPEVVERVLERTPRGKLNSIDDVLAADGEARRQASEEVAAVAGHAPARSTSA
ncbi:MAG TPA: 1-deoxy-D-xylulose-5-phosphate reductoisomerase [Candidatus Saccharimonadales bacterium]|nr:1-deoxy-D-xylulose-5-phosphate reductoisomerase [Candidatus Saccharimonadales bacterium]